MKNKLLISLMIAASSSAFSGKMLAPGVELISEKNTITGNATGYYVDTTGSFFFDAFLTAQTSLVTGKVGQNVMITSDHAANIHNRSSHTERYTLIYKVCTNSSCNRQEKTFSLSPHVDYTTSGRLYLNVSFPYVGSYDIEANTQIMGDANGSDIGRSTAIISR